MNRILYSVMPTTPDPDRVCRTPGETAKAVADLVHTLRPGEAVLVSVFWHSDPPPARPRGARE